MVDKKYIDTTISQDLLAINLAYSNIDLDNPSELPIVSVIPKKPGLDDINGKYVVDGGVALGKVSTRNNKQTKIGEIVGYKVSRLKVDPEGNVIYNGDEPIVVETKLVTKTEGLHLVQFMGARNAYIRTREKKKRAKDGTVLKTEMIAHLQPSPPKTQAFLQDGRLVLIYKVDSYGNRLTPVELTVEEDECSINLWKVIYADFQGKRKRQKTRKNVTDIKREQEENLKNLRKSLILQNRSVINPFATQKEETPE